jgi:cytochrome c-type biogenesis protein CcmH/NrfF
MTKRRLLWISPVAAVVLAFAWYMFAARYTPAGQPPLATVQQGSLAELRTDFNRHADKVRVIVLLSPT